MINGDNATFKRVFKSDKGIVIQPINTSVCDPCTFTNDEIKTLPVTILGVALERRTKM